MNVTSHLTFASAEIPIGLLLSYRVISSAYWKHEVFKSLWRSLTICFGRLLFSFSHHYYKLFMLFFQQHWSLLLFLSLALSLFSTLMYTYKLSRNKESASLLLLFISKSPGGCAIYRRNTLVLEMQNFTPAYMKEWTYIRTIFSEPKFLGCMGN